MRYPTAIVASFWPLQFFCVCQLLAQFGPELKSPPQLGYQTGQALPATELAGGNSLMGTANDPSKFVFGPSSNSSNSLPMEPGIYQLRVTGRLGLSNSRKILVTPEPWAMVTTNESEVNPANISPGTIWQDECPERGRNYYRIRVDKDQRLTLQSFASALDSRARLVLTLMNSDRNTIATNSATNERDPVLTADLKSNTDYAIVVHDHLFRGGSDYRYALKLFEPSSSPENDQNAIALWRQVMTSKQSASPGPLNHVWAWHPRTAMLRSPTDAPTVFHSEATAPDVKSITIDWPVLVAGEFNGNGDIDVFDLASEANTDISIEMISQRIGELSDGAMSVFRVENPGQSNEVLHRIAEQDDPPPFGNGELRFDVKDPMLTFQTKEKGIYRIHVRSQQRLDSSIPNPKYAIEIRKPNPGFVLGVHQASPVVAADQAGATSATLCSGGAVMYTVHALRLDNFNDPIELSVLGLPVGIRGGFGVMASDQNAATLNLWNSGSNPTLPNSAMFAELEIHGHVEIGTKSISSIAKPLEVTRNAIDTFRSPIARVSQSLYLQESTVTPCPLTIELGPAGHDTRAPIRLDGIRGQSIKVPIRVIRRAGGEAAITVRLHHGPTKATAAEVKIEPKSSEGVLELKIPKEAPLGEYMLAALCESIVTVPNTEPEAKEKTKSITLQLPSTSIRFRIGDAP